MDIKITVTSKPESDEYLKIIYNGKKYALDDFAKNFQDEEDRFKLDKLSQNCQFQYKGKVFTYKELCFQINMFCDSLPLLSLYNSKIYPIEKTQIFCIDRDYYAAGKLVESAEKQLMLARLALIKAQCIIDYNVNISWVSGYTGIYYFRSIEANNSIMWYNNVFDSIMQIVFIAFGIYKKHPQYSEDLDYHKTLKLCDYIFLSKYYGKNKNIANFKFLWKIISKAHTGNNNVNQWANYIKHKGGISFKGITADDPFSIMVKNPDGESINDTYFEPLQLDLDEVVEELKNSHLILCNVLEEIVDFIGFEKVQFINNGDKLVIPKKEAYKKIIID